MKGLGERIARHSGVTQVDTGLPERLFILPTRALDGILRSVFAA